MFVKKKCPGRVILKVTLLFLFTLPSSTYSWQVPLSADFRIGGGLSIFSTKEVQNQETGQAWTVGADLSWRLNEWFSFEPGLQLSKESAFGFLSFPLISKISLPLGGADPYFFIGPYFSLSMVKPSDQMRSIDFGSIQGVGCFIPIHYKLALFVDLRFKVGAMDLDSRDGISNRSRSLQLNTGVALPI